MIRSILVALDDTEGAARARDLALELTRRTGARLTAAVILDRPHLADTHEPVPIGGAAFKSRRDAARTRRAEAEAEAALAACAASAGETPFTPLHLQEAPVEALRAAGTTHDLIVIGRDSTLGMEETDDEVAPAIAALLHEGARPLLVVPPEGAPATGGIVVGYDGSVPAQHSLQLFALLGLADGLRARVISMSESLEEAHRLADEATAYLRSHGIDAVPLALEGTRPVEALLTEALAEPAKLLVIGAFEHGALRSLFTGSATQKLLRDAPCPVFVAH